VAEDEVELPTELPTTPTTPVMVFEGAVVAKHEGRIPAITLDMVEGYVRGTHLVLQLELRVRSVRMEEDKHGELVRQHMFVLEEVVLVSSSSAQQAAEASRVGGSASQQEQDEAQDEADDQPEIIELEVDDQTVADWLSEGGAAHG